MNDDLPDQGSARNGASKANSILSKLVVRICFTFTELMLRQEKQTQFRPGGKRLRIRGKLCRFMAHR
jgi:hypothetical protein